MHLPKSPDPSVCRLYPNNTAKNTLAFEEKNPRTIALALVYSTVCGSGKPSLQEAAQTATLTTAEKAESTESGGTGASLP